VLARTALHREGVVGHVDGVADRLQRLRDLRSDLVETEGPIEVSAAEVEVGADAGVDDGPVPLRSNAGDVCEGDTRASALILRPSGPPNAAAGSLSVHLNTRRAVCLGSMGSVIHQASIDLTDNCGGLRCARVHPPALEWSTGGV
jgi:hypothetical protein